MYNKLLDKELFRTQIGINYLKQLQQFLYVSDEIPNDKIRPIPVNFELQEVLDGRREITNNKGKIYRLTREKDSYKDKYTKLIIVNIVLVLIIVAMIAITMTSSNPTIIDYENKLVDKYAGWQERLELQEESLEQREQELLGR